jgi:hypothetical protein
MRPRLPERLSAGMAVECQTEGGDEFPTHSGGYRKTGAGLLAARPRPPDRWASHEGWLFGTVVRIGPFFFKGLWCAVIETNSGN